MEYKRVVVNFHTLCTGLPEQKRWGKNDKKKNGEKKKKKKKKEKERKKKKEKIEKVGRQEGNFELDARKRGGESVGRSYARAQGREDKEVGVCEQKHDRRA